MGSLHRTAMFPLLLAATFLATGCDATHTNRLTVSVQAGRGAAPPGDLVVESRWFEDSVRILKAGKAEEVRDPGGHQPTADWPCERKAVPGVPVKEGVVQLDFSYAVGPIGGSFRPLEATWFAVWRLPRDRWFPQEFVIVVGKDGPEVRRLIREKGRGSLGATVGAPEVRMSGNSSIKEWGIALPMEEWVERKP